MQPSPRLYDQWLLFSCLRSRMPTRIRFRAGREARQEFANLLRRYRCAQKLSQGQLARASGFKSQSYIAMLESGDYNPPSGPRLERLISSLKLTPEERSKLRLAAAGQRGAFLRLNREEIGEEVSSPRTYTRIWIIGSVPLEFADESVYSAVLDLLGQGRTHFVYWIPRSKVTQFDRLLARLKSDLSKEGTQTHRLVGLLECILLPELGCMHQCALYDPHDPERIAGRLGVPDADGLVSGAIPMEASYALRVYRLLEPIYNELRSRSSIQLPDGGTVNLHFPVRTRGGD